MFFSFFPPSFFFSFFIHSTSQIYSQKNSQININKSSKKIKKNWNKSKSHRATWPLATDRPPFPPPAGHPSHRLPSDRIWRRGGWGCHHASGRPASISPPRAGLLSAGLPSRRLSEGGEEGRRGEGAGRGGRRMGERRRKRRMREWEERRRLGWSKDGRESWTRVAQAFSRVCCVKMELKIDF